MQYSLLFFNEYTNLNLWYEIVQNTIILITFCSKERVPCLQDHPTELVKYQTIVYYWHLVYIQF